MDPKSDFRPLAFKDAWNLCAPHTWPASIFPVLLAVSLAYGQGHAISIVSSIILLLISVCLQSAVNSLNDYFDFVKGTDSADDNLEESDSVLVSEHVNPKSALLLTIGLVIAALIMGIYCICVAGWLPLAIAVIGICVIALYSGGRTPISYLPIGEVVSGIVMGMLITLASYVVLTKGFDWMVLLWSLPEVLGIGLIMMTNNTCDIEKDANAGRHTLPTLLGRSKSVAAYHAIVVCWYCAIWLIVGFRFTPGLLVCLFMTFASYPVARALFANPLSQRSRIAAMSQICSMNIVLGAFYCMAIVFGATVILSL